MSLPIGPHIMMGFDGYTLSSEVRDLIEREKIGSVILFERNYESPEQLANLCNQIQEAGKNSGPLFISVDHEGGRVWRFKDFTKFPPMAKIGNLDSPKTTFEIHGIMATELKAAGVNMMLAPVADILTETNGGVIGDRSFGSSEELVSKHVSAAVRGIQKSGVIPCLKHFPGHGNTIIDSHLDLPKVQIPAAELENHEWQPFRKGIKSKADCVMTAHILNTEIDPDYPATMSPKTMKVLREDFRFQGLILSDDLEMKAVSERFSYEESAWRSIQAGCDILIIKDAEHAPAMIDGIREALVQGFISEEDLKESQKRINRIKKEFQIGSKVDPSSTDELIHNEANKEVLQTLLDQLS